MKHSLVASRTILEWLLVQLIGATALTVAAFFGTFWSLSGIVAWIVAFSTATVRAGLRRLAAGGRVGRSIGTTAVSLGLPFLAAFAVLAPELIDPPYTLPVLIALLCFVGAAWPAGAMALVFMRMRRPLPSVTHVPSARPSAKVVVVIALLAAALFVAPFAAASASRKDLRRQVNACEDLTPYLRGAPPRTLRQLAEACSQREGPATSQTVAGVRIDAYPGRRDADLPVVLDDATSIVAHLAEVFGPPGFGAIVISPISIPGPVRGQAGKGILLIDSAELIAPRACGDFRGSAGAEGTCGTWVLAHEIAHQWFPGRADLGPVSDQVAWEGTADYLAWSWWRKQYGSADAMRLLSELFQGRMRLEPAFVVSRSPGRQFGRLSDSESQALIYGRGSLAWIAAERQAGRDAVRAILRDAHAGTGQGTMTLDTILDAAGKDTGVAEVLRSWWLDASFDPQLPPESD